MKRMLSSLVAFGVATVFLASCGNSDGTQNNNGDPGTGSDMITGIDQGEMLLSSMLATVSSSSGINSSLVLAKADLLASGDIQEADVLGFYGVQSMTYQQDGGTVYVVKAAPDKAQAIVDGLTNINNALLAQGENYQAEFPDAYAHLENAIIKAEGDYVIYAVSSNGDYESLASAVDTALQMGVTSLY